MNMFDWRKEKILITGGTGLIGYNLTKKFQAYDMNYLSVGKSRGDYKCDLTDQISTKKLFEYYRPKVVFHLAAKVGGIFANVNKKSDFYLENTQINTNVIGAIQNMGIPFVFAMGTGCAYPKIFENNILFEENFLDGIPEVTNDAYAYSKRNLLVHLKACKENHSINYIYCIPSNIYGPYDNFHPKYSHVVPGLIVKFLSAINDNQSSVVVGGAGHAKRDFLFINDLIDAIIMLCDNFKNSQAVNVASGASTSIDILANKIKKISGFKGNLEYDLNYPEGQKQRSFDISKIRKIGWIPKHSLELGLKKTIDWCHSNQQLIK